MIITKKSLPRRTVLRGLGVTLALPLLDGMVPALSALRNTAAQPVRRLTAVYVPNGMNMATWTPTVVGADFEMTRVLEPLAAFRDRLLVLSGMSSGVADALPGEGNGDHGRSQAAFLTGVHAKKTVGADVEAGVSMDQILAREFGQHTQLASLELALEANDMIGACELGLSCAYSATLAWRDATTPLPMENNPRALFERLFGSSDSTDAAARLARIRSNRSILDSVTADLRFLAQGLGAGDRTRLDEYSEAVRDIERRLQMAETQRDVDLPVIEQPGGIPADFEEYATLMFDLLAVAYQADLTRVGTFLFGREQSGRTYPEVGVPDPHHPVSHHGWRPADMEKLTKINTFHVKLFAHFLDKLRSIPDGDGTLLDHAMVVYGAGMSDSHSHLHNDLPILVAGGGAGQISGGRHVQYAEGTPLANLHLTLLDKMGVPVERLGDSTSNLAYLSDV